MTATFDRGTGRLSHRGEVVVLRGRGASLLYIMCQGFGRFIGADILINTVYTDRPNATGVDLHNLLHRVRPKIAPLGLVIESDRSGNFRLIAQ